MSTLRLNNNTVVPALVVEKTPEPVIDVREMPQDWKYYKTLAEGDYDNCFLFYKGASATFSLQDFTGATTITLYGGSDGMQPLYRLYWAINTSDRYWAHYENGGWVRNTTQPSSITKCLLEQADLDNYEQPFPLTLNDLQGKPITDDTHLGTTELFTVVVHSPEGVTYNNGKLIDDYANGGSATNSRITYPLVAYYGTTNGLKASEPIRTPDLEFVEFISASSVIALSTHVVKDSYWLGKLSVPTTVTMVNEKGCLGCRALQEVNYPVNATSIPNQMFNNCVNLKKITFGNSITSIEASALRSTYNLKKIKLPNTVQTIGQYAFTDSGIEEINFPTSLTTINSYAFQKTKIKEAILPNSVTTIGSNAFDSCSSLEKVYLPNTLANIDANVFSNCGALNEIELPSTLVVIGNNAFNGCSTLRNVTLPNGLSSIGQYAFYNCFSLEEIIIPQGCIIGSFAFGYCDGLKKVTLPNGLTQLSPSTFVQCKSMVEYNLPNTLTMIGTSVFAYNFNVVNLTIPASVTSIGASAFGYMGACRYFKMLGEAPTLGNANAFATGNTYVKILIPYEYIDDYQTATNWSSNTNNILRKQRGYKTFTQGTTLPTQDLTGTYDLTWYDDFSAILNTTATGTPSATPVTVASHDGEYYCTIS